MRARSSGEVALLRVLIAAIDNAQSVPMGEEHRRYVELKFGDGSAEVPRLELSETDLAELLQGEAEAREAHAVEFERLNQQERAKAMRDEAAWVRRYL